MATNTAGFIYNTNPYIFVEGFDAGTRTIALLTLYNPNSSAVDFVLRLVLTDDQDRELEVTRFDDAIAPTSTWPFGHLMSRMVVLPGQRYEIVLDSAPTLGVHCVCDIG